MTHIVVYDTKVNGLINSHWRAFDTFDEALEFYNQLVDQDDTYSATLCKPIMSTDYDCEL